MVALERFYAAYSCGARHFLGAPNSVLASVDRGAFVALPSSATGSGRTQTTKLSHTSKYSF